MHNMQLKAQHDTYTKVVLLVKDWGSTRPPVIMFEIRQLAVSSVVMAHI